MSNLSNIWQEWVKKYGEYDDNGLLTINTRTKLNDLINMCRSNFQEFELAKFRKEKFNNSTDVGENSETSKLFHMVLYIFLIKDLTENATTENNALGLILEAFKSIQVKKD